MIEQLRKNLAAAEAIVSEAEREMNIAEGDHWPDRFPAAKAKYEVALDLAETLLSKLKEEESRLQGGAK